MILVIDNFDSFTYNLVQYIGEINSDIEVYRNNTLSAEEIYQKKPSHIIVSPGPCTPTEAGVSVETIKNLPSSIPLLGVCLGHQSIAQAFGGKIIRAPYVMHGKTSPILAQDCPLFNNIPTPFIATRYHSLIVERESLPNELEIKAETEDGIIMALQHKQKKIFGIQFHPESILTEQGKTIINNFLKIKG